MIPKPKEVACTETVLRRVFELLPQAQNEAGTTFPIVYSWGTQEDCNMFLRSRVITGNYPLLWCVSGVDEINEFEGYRPNCRLILANNTTRKGELTEETYSKDFDYILNPLCENVKRALISSKLTEVRDRLFTERRITNYGENGTEAQDVWNVIVLEFNLHFKFDVNQCVGNLFFDYEPQEIA